MEGNVPPDVRKLLDEFDSADRDAEALVGR